MSGVRDLPPIAGSIIWAKQIDRQLTTYMRRVEYVLGKGWENHVEGQKLKADGDSFRAKLNTQDIFDDWARKVQQRNLGVSGRIFAIENQRNRRGQGSRGLIPSPKLTSACSVPTGNNSRYRHMVGGRCARD